MGLRKFVQLLICFINICSTLIHITLLLLLLFYEQSQIVFLFSQNDASLKEMC